MKCIEFHWQVNGSVSAKQKKGLFLVLTPPSPLHVHFPEGIDHCKERKYKSSTGLTN